MQVNEYHVGSSVVSKTTGAVGRGDTTSVSNFTTTKVKMTELESKIILGMV